MRTRTLDEALAAFELSEHPAWLLKVEVLGDGVMIFECCEKFEQELTLRNMQEAVGGLIEIVPLNRDAELVVNEEGKLIGLPQNAIATDLFGMAHGYGIDIVVGSVLLVKTGVIK